MLATDAGACCLIFARYRNDQPCADVSPAWTCAWEAGEMCARRLEAVDVSGIVFHGDGCPQ
jgi:hypothetical protein